LARSNLGLIDGKVNIIFISRIVEGKGLSILIESLINIKYLSNIRLLIIGNGDPNYIDRIKKNIIKASYSLPEIVWLGPLWGVEKWKYLQAADLLCLPSVSENFGFVILEALQVGTPILTSFNTPWSEIMEGTRGGLFTGLDAHSIREALEIFLSSPEWSLEDRVNLSKWTHKKFNWEDIINEFNELFTEMLKDHVD
jgi:glycosyltransferase involved in cell wall biosynthesis